MILDVMNTGMNEDGLPEDALGWCLVANVARETARGEAGLDIQRGTRHFAPGALLWIPPGRWDPGHRRVHAVGRHRGNARRYVNMVVRVDDLENFRVKGIYSDALVRGLNGYHHDPAAPRTLQNPWTRERAQSYADSWNLRSRAFSGQEPCVRKSRCELHVLMLKMYFIRRHISDSRVESLAIVPEFDVPCDVSPGFFSSCVCHAANALVL
ncbi:hypothetical protein EDD99_6895 [Streptomyces sp. 846.5]|nr:hypothetical protein EDD99_6895 [Streptomyces sp. 846.5]